MAHTVASGGQHLPEGGPLLRSGGRGGGVDTRFLCSTREGLQRCLGERDPVRGERGQVGEGRREELVPLDRGGATEIIGCVPPVGPDQLVVLPAGNLGGPEVSAVASKAPPTQGVHLLPRTRHWGGCECNLGPRVGSGQSIRQVMKRSFYLAAGHNPVIVSLRSGLAWPAPSWPAMRLASRVAAVLPG